MPRAVSVVIPALNEEKVIEAAVRSAHAVAGEIIVVDGGSTDGTTSTALAAGARVIRSGVANRGRQLNDGARASVGDVLLFLHADSALPPTALEEISSAIDRGFEFGGFRIRFRQRTAALRVAERMINLRTRLTRCPWGDQAQFVTRSRFDSAAGFRELPLMEDYEFATRMRRETRCVLLTSAVVTSGRRFLRLGVLNTAILNWLIVIAYRWGVSAERLARIYRSL